MSLDQIVTDGIAVAEFLRSDLGERSIFLLGHSWGAAVAVHMARRRPDLFAAVATTGLLVNFERNEQINFEKVMARATLSQNAAALHALSEIGPPPYDDPADIRVLREWADKVTDGAGDRPYPSVRPPVDFTADDRAALMKGFEFSIASLFPELCRIDLPALGPTFEIPMFCLMGSHDQQTPVEEAERYFETLRAPRKSFVRFDGCHHFVHMNRPEAFLEALVELLRM